MADEIIEADVLRVQTNSETAAEAAARERQLAAIVDTTDPVEPNHGILYKHIGYDAAANKEDYISVFQAKGSDSEHRTVTVENLTSTDVTAVGATANGQLILLPAADSELREAQVTAVVRGGEVSLNAGVDVNITEGEGRIMDAYTDTESLTTETVTWVGEIYTITGLPSSYTGGVFLYKDSTGVTQQGFTAMTRKQRRTNFELCLVSFDAGVIVRIFDIRTMLNSQGRVVNDYFDFLSLEQNTKGTSVLPVLTPSLSVYFTSGSLFQRNINKENDPQDENVLSIPGIGDENTPAVFDVVLQDGTVHLTAQTVIPKLWEDTSGGGSVVNTLSGQKASIGYFYRKTDTGNAIYQLGQNEYTDGAKAQNSLLSDNYSHVTSDAARYAVLRAQIWVSAGASNFEDAAQAGIRNIDDAGGGVTNPQGLADVLEQDNNGGGFNIVNVPKMVSLDGRKELQFNSQDVSLYCISSDQARDAKVEVETTTIASQVAITSSYGTVDILAAGALGVTGIINLNGNELRMNTTVISASDTRIEDVEDPFYDQDAATKNYVDTELENAIGGLPWLPGVYIQFTGEDAPYENRMVLMIPEGALDHFSGIFKLNVRVGNMTPDPADRSQEVVFAVSDEGSDDLTYGIKVLSYSKDTDELDTEQLIPRLVLGRSTSLNRRVVGFETDYTGLYSDLWVTVEYLNKENAQIYTAGYNWANPDMVYFIPILYQNEAAIPTASTVTNPADTSNGSSFLQGNTSFGEFVASNIENRSFATTEQLISGEDLTIFGGELNEKDIQLSGENVILGVDAVSQYIKVEKTGDKITAPALTAARINAGGDFSLVTKKYGDDNWGGGTPKKTLTLAFGADVALTTNQVISPTAGEGSWSTNKMGLPVPNGYELAEVTGLINRFVTNNAVSDVIVTFRIVDADGTLSGTVNGSSGTVLTSFSFDDLPDTTGATKYYFKQDEIYPGGFTIGDNKMLIAVVSSQSVQSANGIELLVKVREV